MLPVISNQCVPRTCFWIVLIAAMIAASFTRQAIDPQVRMMQPTLNCIVFRCNSVALRPRYLNNPG